MSLPSATINQICTQITSTLSLHPSSTWLRSALASQRPTTPLSALTATAKIRLLNADLCSCLSCPPNLVFPSDIHSLEIKERKFQGPIAVQVMGIEDMTKSRWEQIEAIEAAERGEGTKGREIIRVTAVADGTGEGEGSGSGSGGMCKILLQDAKGLRVWGIEVQPVKGLKLGMNIGTKIILRDITVARGVLLLKPQSVTILGGKMESLHKAWTENRKADLRAAIDAEAT
ncbi:MAG: hypothetical protein M1817_006711 [Caeruleum heppii]|nr:MAG: hypothetical protein M1817_006711 [Caeruleum heppii]